jgi:hypothetical protein
MEKGGLYNRSSIMMSKGTRSVNKNFSHSVIISIFINFLGERRKRVGWGSIEKTLKNAGNSKNIIAN